jgi:RNA-binding protein YlmH
MTKRSVLERLPGDQRQLLAHAWDKAEQAERDWRIAYSYFLDPGQRSLIHQYSYLWSAGLASFGGYPGAEREIIAFLPDDCAPVANDYPLLALQVTGNFQFAKLAHRDYLGSLLALGIKREFLGDILVRPTGGQVMVHQSVADYLLCNWSSIGSAAIQVEVLDLTRVEPPQGQRQVRTATVASLRLDAVVAAAYQLSRSEAAALIRGGKLKLNFLPEQRVDRVVEEGAILSLAGQGRAELIEVGGVSRKGRIHIQVARWR